jgi:hypothetical protein
MALAFLFQQFNRLYLGSELDLTALTVDHANRRESAGEALTVSGWLKDIGEICLAAKAPRLTEGQASSPVSCA